MLRRTLLLSAGVLFLLVGPVSAGGRMATDPYVGTWEVKNLPGFGDQNTPWKNGGTITIKAASRTEVEAYGDVEFVGHPLQEYCLGRTDPPAGYTPPVVSAWYLVSSSWDGAAGGCISNLTDRYIDFWGPGGAGQVTYATARGQLCPEAPCLTGVWRSDPLKDWWYLFAPEGSAGTTKTVSEPAPGKQVSVDSPPVPASCADSSVRAAAQESEAQRCKITIEHADRSSRIATITATGGEGDLWQASAGEFIFWCWLDYDFVDDNGAPRNFSAVKQLQACIWLTTILAHEGKLGKPKRMPARSAAVSAATATSGAGCKTKAIPIALRKRGGKLVVAGRAKKAKLPAGSTRYQCSYSDGKATLAVTAPRGLRKAVGKTLTLGVYKQKKAPRTRPKLRVTFGW